MFSEQRLRAQGQAIGAAPQAANFDASVVEVLAERAAPNGVLAVDRSANVLWMSPRAKSLIGGRSLPDANDGDNDTDCTQSPAGPYTLGATQVTLTCTDRASRQSSSCTGTVTVLDATPPVVTTNPGDNGGFIASVWPPNHTFHTVSLSDCVSAAADQCDGANVIQRIFGVSSDERSQGPGSVDLVIADGRVYTMFAVVADNDGNATQVSCKVAVPLDQSGEPAVDSGTADCVGTCN
jgi:hypothetical protein